MRQINEGITENRYKQKQLASSLTLTNEVGDVPVNARIPWRLAGTWRK
jgi:hypothetical protein